MRFLRRLLKWLLGIVVVLVLAIVALALLLRHPLPEGGTTGPAADALARALEKSVNADAWARTGAVRWGFSGRHQHLWDRQRMLSRVRWGSNEVLMDLSKQEGRAYVNGVEVSGPEKQKLVEKAWALWINDSFWLNPITKAFDDGVTRSLVKVGARDALLLSYAGGGVTPGDKYLWIPGDDGKPAAWRMWVRIIPVGGLEFSWGGWTTLSTGAVISTEHRLGPLRTVFITDLAGASTLAELEPGPDPFARLLAK